MNAAMMQSKVKLIEIGKHNRGSWALAAIDLLIVLGLWAAVAYTPAAPKPVAVDPATRAQVVSAANAQSVPALPVVVQRLQSSYFGASHGAACNASPAGCGGKTQLRPSDPAVACHQMSHAIQHRTGELSDLSQCAGMN